MKKTMIIALMSMFSYITVNAENEELNNMVADQPATVEATVAVNTEATEINEAEATEAETTSAEVTNAEANEAEATETEATEDAKPIENELMLQYPNLYSTQSEASVPAANYYNEGYRQDTKWKHARNLRNIGMILTLAGYVAEIPLAVHFAKEIKPVEGNSEVANVANVVVGELGFFGGVGKAAMYCAVPILGGIAMWITGNCLMRKARLSYTGNGVAYNF